MSHIPPLQFAQLQFFANKIACYYYAPVYLIGSAIDKIEYRDVDIVVVLPDTFFELRYGRIADLAKEKNGIVPPKIMIAVAKDCCKNWARGCTLTGLNLDFKILPDVIFRNNYNTTKIRIDQVLFGQKSK